MAQKIEQEETKKLSQSLAEEIARHFNLVFTRSTMYSADHPSVKSIFPEFFKVMQQAIKMVSPISFILVRDSFYIEEWCVDKRVNLFRIVTHFKKSDVSSITFEKGMTMDDLRNFFNIFSNIKRYPNVSKMKDAMIEKNVHFIKLNYVIFKKITADEKVVTRWEAINQLPKDVVLKDKPLKDSEVAHLTLKEFERNLSLYKLMEDPISFSRALLNLELNIEDNGSIDEFQIGSQAARELIRIRRNIKDEKEKITFPNLEEMVDAVYKMRKDLLEGIEAHKAMGIIFKEEGLIKKELDNLTKEVILRLIREEYKQGKISVKRLGQLIRRMMPDVKEIRRILPELKQTLLDEGMPMADYLELIKELGEELKSEGIMQLFDEAAKEIGLDPDELVKYIKEDPKSAAELIVLAAEIRKKSISGDEKVLTEILVEYIEKVGTHMALEEAYKEGIKGGTHLENLITRIEQTLLSHLKDYDIDNNVLIDVDKKLKERVATTLDNLKSSWILKHIVQADTLPDTERFIEILESTLEYGHELEDILDPVRKALQRKGATTEQIDELYKGVLKRLQEKEKKKVWGDLPERAFNRQITLFLLDGEIKRALRYSSYTFSAITLCMVAIEYKSTLTMDMDLDTPELRNIVLALLGKTVRDVDIIGTLGENRIFIILPMTDINGAHIVRGRIDKYLNERRYMVQGVNTEVTFAVSATGFDPKKTFYLQGFIKKAERDLSERILEKIKEKKRKRKLI